MTFTNLSAVFAFCFLVTLALGQADNALVGKQGAGSWDFNMR